MAVTTLEEPMLSRLDRLDKIMKQLEEIKGGNKTPKSSCASTPSTCTVTSNGQVSSSVDFSPRRFEKHCRPIDDVIAETEMKGTLIERLVDVEGRVAKLCMELQFEEEKKRVEEEKNTLMKNNKKKKGLKQLIKCCVTRN